ncbi:prephenate dehydratase [Staphylococcus arlettae]|nr:MULTISPECIES: prephenate dehydratase domain-containing protein [Staphylococcus]EJY96527.1 prephenate dehydratase [Staphylococcus arlettae CVD059]ERF49406.1 prephenate dehydratase [Staphylococcus sp. EGD-HP3]KAB2477687.1 prephenate dehydratase [Staphylococcus sp. CH99b_3]MCD8816875.1 prephenate dehydratase [Staphylococcus arlettae]MCD8839939.1 prephenate dehydratase [Staphylococcus arlettae]
MKLYYLGPKGTFSYLAALQYKSEQEMTYIPKTNLYEVVNAVSLDSNSVAVVPIENSIEGTINIVADALTQQNIYAQGEIHLDIQFALYGDQESSVTNIEKVYSIAPAISQTSQFIQKQGYQYDYVDSTVKSLEKITPTVGAIAPLGSGEAHGYSPLMQNIQDYPHNVTRFLVVSNQAQHTTNASDTILLITPKHDKPGLLASILNTFALFDINLSWIESRPLKTQLGMYHFFVQADSSMNENLNKVITILNTLDFHTKLIGSFNKIN